MTPQRRTALVSVLVAIALIGLKLGTGLATHSLGLISEAAHSGTDLIAALLTFVQGAYAELGDMRVAAASAAAAAAVLILREGLHGWVARITRVEFESGLLLAMTFIVCRSFRSRAAR